MTDLRKAAERLRDFLENRNGRNTLGTHLTGDKTYDDLADVALAYLSEHPADDDEPIDEAWLRTINCTHDLEPGGASFRWDATSMLITEDGVTFDTKAGYGCNVKLKTRRDVRLLCKALGIELEPTIEADVPIPEEVVIEGRVVE